MAAGYTSTAWLSEAGYNDDEEAFVCSLTNEMRVFRPNNPSRAVFLHSRWGPCFNDALAVWYPMNGENKGRCYVKDHKNESAKYCVETNTEGNSVLTGDGGNNNDGRFTCTGLEVFLIE